MEQMTEIAGNMEGKRLTYRTFGGGRWLPMRTGSISEIALR